MSEEAGKLGKDWLILLGGDPEFKPQVKSGWGLGGEKAAGGNAANNQ